MLGIHPLLADDDNLVHDLLTLFNEAYNPPPWGETTAENAATIVDMLREAEGWRGVVLLDGHRLVGVAQGSFGSVLRGDLERLDPVLAAGLTVPLFEFHQLVVSRSARGRGFGSQLHDHVMAGLRSDAILATHPEAVDALRLYRARGWRDHGTLEVVPGIDRTIMSFRADRRP